MFNVYTLSTALIFVMVVMVAIAGHYETQVSQPDELARIADAKEAHRLNQELEQQLAAQEAASSARADEMVRKWRARYKYIPARMETPDVLKYLESLSASGFEQFSVSLKSQGTTKDFRYYVFAISGTAYYPSLYQFIWKLENNMNFYQVDNLQLNYTDVFKTNEETGVQRRLEMVNFSLQMKAFYAGTEGMSAPEGELVEVPEGLFPRPTPAHNSFYPLVRAELPPNDELLVDIEKAELVSIVGTRAIFQDGRGQFVLNVGDAVYLGRITAIDPVNILVRAVLNKGGVQEVVEKRIEVGDYQLQRPAQEAPEFRRAPITTDQG